MRKLFFILMIFVISIPAFAQVNGFVTNIDGNNVIKVWGTHYERGYAQGYLLADEMVEVFDEYIIGSMLMGSATNYNLLRNVFNNYFDVNEKYQTEAQGFIAGMTDSGSNMTSSYLGRDLDVTDILICNSIPDLSVYSRNLFNKEFEGGCSSLTSWGDSTIDSELNGDLVITRMLDWTSNITLLSNTIIIVHEPSEEDEQPWLSFGFPGMFAALSGINSSGVAVFQNMGNVHDRLDDGPFNPILFTTREAIEMIDYNGDEVCNVVDVQSALQEKGSFFGAIIQSATNADEELPVAVFEINDAAGLATRTLDDNIQIAGTNLAATNHFRKLYNVSYCPRYLGLISATNNDSLITPQSSIEYMADNCGVPSNVHVIQYQPASGTIKLAVADNQPAYLNDYAEYNLNQLLDLEVANQNDAIAPATKVAAYPNPFNPSTTIMLNFDSKQDFVDLKIMNIKGQIVRDLSLNAESKKKINVNWNGLDKNGNMVSSGIYFLKAKAGNEIVNHKLIMIK